MPNDRAVRSSDVATGRCLCGDVRVEVRGEPLWTGHCHCRSCRRNTASLVATFVGYHPEAVKFPAASRRVFESSPGVLRGFCARCGTPISYESSRFPDEIHLYVGLMDDPARFSPAFHVHFAERIEGFEIADDLLRFPGGASQ